MKKKGKEAMRTGMAQNWYEQTARAGLGVNCRFDRTAKLGPRSQSPYTSKIQLNFSQHHA